MMAISNRSNSLTVPVREHPRLVSSHSMRCSWTSRSPTIDYDSNSFKTPMMRTPEVTVDFCDDQPPPTLGSADNGRSFDSSQQLDHRLQLSQIRPSISMSSTDESTSANQLERYVSFHNSDEFTSANQLERYLSSYNSDEFTSANQLERYLSSYNSDEFTSANQLKRYLSSYNSDEFTSANQLERYFANLLIFFTRRNSPLQPINCPILLYIILYIGHYPRL